MQTVLVQYFFLKVVLSIAFRLLSFMEALLITSAVKTFIAVLWPYFQYKYTVLIFVGLETFSQLLWERNGEVSFEK